MDLNVPLEVVSLETRRGVGHAENQALRRL